MAFSLRLLGVIAVLTIGAIGVFAGSNFNSGNGSFDWTNPAGWTNGNGNVPGGTDTANLTTGSASVNGSVSVGVVSLGGGGLTGSGTLTITSTGSEWQSGSVLAFSGNGGLIIASGANLLISGTPTGNHDFDNGTITNNGTINWTGGTLRSGSGGSITNTSIFNDSASNVMSNPFGGTFTFTNTGTYNKTASGTTQIGAIFANSGTVNVQLGTLSLTGGGTNSGTVNLSTGTFLEINSDIALNSGSNFTGAGILNILGGTLTLNAVPTISLSTLNWSGGTITGSADFGAPTGTTFGWSGGTLSGSGAMAVAPGGTLNLSGSPTLSRSTFTNAGTVNYNPTTSLALGGNTAFVNANGATWDLKGDKTFSVGSGTHSFTNQSGGLLTKSGGTGTFTFNLPVTNAGVVQASSGTLSFTSTFTNDNSGSIVLTGGAISFAGSTSIGTGTLTGAGTVSVGSGNTLTSGGAISPGNGLGLLNITGNLTLLSTASFVFQIGGATQSTLYDHVDISGLLTLNGQLVVTTANSFTPSKSDTFTLIDAGSLSGSFTNVSSGSRLTIGAGTGSFLVSYGGGSSSIVLSDFTAVPEPSTYALMLMGAVAFLGRYWKRRRD